MSLFQKDHTALIAFVERFDSKKEVTTIHDIYCACKGECDRTLESAALTNGYVTGWIDISDLAIPIEFMRFLFASVNRLREGRDVYEKEAYDKLKTIIIALAQKVLRFTTEEEKDRFLLLRQMDF